MSPLLDNWQQKARLRAKATLRFLQKLRGKSASLARGRLGELHQEAFSCIDCQQCANCCKTISPRFKTPDIRRIARFLQVKESVLIERHLRLDEEGDYVTQTSPCPFLQKDNSCGIYEARPGDCRQYPYTDRDVLLKRPRLTMENSMVCPAVFYVVEKLKEMG